MTADSPDGFGYEAARLHTSRRARQHYWAVAIGLQKVDGLEVSSYVEELAHDYVAGTKSLDQTGELIRHYHDAGGADAQCETREADLVSQRIAELLAGAPFFLGPQILPQIHRYLFQDLDHDTYLPGIFKTERMVKQEEILNGDSVLYADPLTYEQSLQMAFSTESQHEYGTTMTCDDLQQFCHTIAFLWQVHPFAEGNTRTIAVFSELYLNYLGFNVTNESFEKHSRFFRDALVRAIYRNAQAGILPDRSYLEAFYDNAVNDAGHTLSRETLICSELFEHPGFLRNIGPEEALVKRP